MIDPREVSKAAALFVERSLEASSLGARIHARLTPDWHQTHRRVMDIWGNLAAEADAAMEVLFSAAREWGFNPNAFTDYRAHPNSETRGAAWALARRLQERADAEDRFEGARGAGGANAATEALTTNTAAHAAPDVAEGKTAAYCWRISGNVWEIQFGDERGHFPEIKGFGILSKLLRYRNASKPITAADCLAAMDKPLLLNMRGKKRSMMRP
jgi:hypothetical protein